VFRASRSNIPVPGDSRTAGSQVRGERGAAAGLRVDAAVLGAAVLDEAGEEPFVQDVAVHE